MKYVYWIFFISIISFLSCSSVDLTGTTTETTGGYNGVVSAANGAISDDSVPPNVPSLAFPLSCL